VNEALSIGLPVIVTDQCGVAEVVRHNGGGCVVPYDWQEFSRRFEAVHGGSMIGWY